MLVKIVLVLVFFGIMIGVGAYSKKMSTSVDGFVLGGRSVGPWLTAFAFGTSYFSAVVTSAHRIERLTTFLGGGDTDSSYHVDNAMLAIGTGGFFGVGIGNSVQATGYLPESINDSVFAIMGETFGFVGLMAVIGTFTILLLRIAKIAENGGEDEHRLIAVGVFSWGPAVVPVRA